MPSQHTPEDRETAEQISIRQRILEESLHLRNQQNLTPPIPSNDSAVWATTAATLSIVSPPERNNVPAFTYSYGETWTLPTADEIDLAVNKPKKAKKKSEPIPDRVDNISQGVDWSGIREIRTLFANNVEMHNFINKLTRDVQASKINLIRAEQEGLPRSSGVCLVYQDARHLPMPQDKAALMKKWLAWRESFINGCRGVYNDIIRYSNDPQAIELREFNRKVPKELQWDLFCKNCHCGIRSTDENSYDVTRGAIVCMDCRNHACKQCVACHHWDFRPNITRLDDGRNYCAVCLEKQIVWECAACEEIYTVAKNPPTTFDGEQLCSKCYQQSQDNKYIMPFFNLSQSPSEVGERYPYRDMSTLRFKRLCSATGGTTIGSTRMFGVEIECIAQSEKEIARLASASPRVLGIGTDNSIRPDNPHQRGIEIRTPRLGGAMGETFMVELSKYLVKNKFMTNASCGFHIHIDGGSDFIKSSAGKESKIGNHAKFLFMFYWIFEDVFQSFLPVTRRENKYCQSLKHAFSLSKVMNAGSLEDIEKIWYSTVRKDHIENSKRSHHHDTRYYGTNLHTLLAENHMEIRYHSGTIQAERILEWVNIHTRIMDKIAADAITYEQLVSVSHIIDMDEKTQAMFDLLKFGKPSQHYFLGRQAKFKVEKKLTEETLTL